MAIASVVQGLIETEGGKVFELDSCKGSAWVESVSSFRYVPTGANKPYTVRQETKKGGDYWYGYRKVAGRLHKKYIGKSSELSRAKLEEIAEALNTPQQPKVTQVTDAVTQVTEATNQRVTDAVTDRHTAERVTALELQMQSLQKSLEELRSVLLGKFEGLGNSSELLNPDKEVTDNGLRTELSNLKAENQALRADYAALLESSTVVTNKLRQELQEVRSQLEAEKRRWDELREELDDSEETCTELRGELETVQAELFDAKAIISSLDPSPVASALRLEIGRLQTEFENCRQQAATNFDLPDAADLLNQLKAKRKKSKTDLGDVETLLEILEPGTD
jgi:chromosome segregation ATPase